MNSAGKCRECGAALPADGPAGICTKCLLALGLAPAQGETVQTVPTEKPGDRIGPYKLLEQIGKGGFGVVYLAEQQEPVKRRVALKIIKLGMDTTQVIARFEAERQALALMDHPNIAKILEAGATETGRPYFVMELVGGIKITDYCEQNNLTTPQRLDLFMQVCRAIQHAHQKGVIHRDIKPSNVLVATQDGVPVPKVIDFGIAKATQGKLTDQTVFTAFEQFLGTPAYMSPEQAQLGTLDVDTRSDIYSLGVLLYELLTGKTPFDTKELLAAGLDEMRRTIREVEPVKPSTRLTQELSRSHRPLTPSLSPAGGEGVRRTGEGEGQVKALINALRGDLDWIVMKCLEKDRARRYETANGLASDVQRHLNHEPVVARPPSRLYEFQKTVRRHKFGFAATAAFMFLLAAGAALSFWQATLATRAKSEALVEKYRADRESAKSRQVASILENMLLNVGPSRALGRDATMLMEIVSDTAKRLDHDVKDQPEVEASLRATLGNVYSDLGEYAGAIAMHRRALELRLGLFGPKHPDSAGSMHDLGRVLGLQGRTAEAEPVAREALRIRRELYGNGHLDVARSLENLALIIHVPLTNRSETLELIREALQLKRNLLGTNNLEVATSLRYTATILNHNGRFTEAESVSREALELRQRLLPSEHPDVADSMQTLAWTFYLEGKLTEAETMFYQTLAMRKKLLGTNHPLIVDTLLNLGATLSLGKKYGQAELVLREALEITKSSSDDKDPALLSPLFTLATVLWRQGNLAEAETLYRQALAIDAGSYGDWHPSVIALLERLACLLREGHKLADAEIVEQQLEQEAIKVAEKGDVDNLNYTAWRLATTRDPRQRNGVRALNISQMAAVATGRTNPVVLATLAAAYAECGQFELAVGTQNEAINLVTDPLLKQSFSIRARLYETNTPYREN